MLPYSVNLGPIEMISSFPALPKLFAQVMLNIMMYAFPALRKASFTFFQSICVSQTLTDLNFLLRARMYFENAHTHGPHRFALVVGAKRHRHVGIECVAWSTTKPINVCRRRRTRRLLLFLPPLQGAFLSASIMYIKSEKSE